MKRQPNRKVVRASIRGSVPKGKLKSASIVLADRPLENGSPIGGFTEYGADRRTVVKLGAPAGDSFRDITIRGHETRHATRHVLARKKPMTQRHLMAAQIVDDVNIETTALPSVSFDGLRTYRRAHIATALKDLQGMLNDDRAVKAGRKAETWEMRNMRLLAAVRTKAILKHYRDGAPRPPWSPRLSSDDRTYEQSIRGSRKLRDLIGVDTSRALNAVIRLAKSSRSRSRAISMLAMLLEAAPERDRYDDEEKEGKTPELDLAPELTGGTSLTGHMDIRDLRPKSVYTAKERTVSVRYAPDGVHLSPNRYVSAIVSGDSHGLFSRRVRQKPGGTVLIDASGSMGVSAENLTALLKLIPTATVAYYSGHDGRGTGVLSIYGQGGLRYAGSLPHDTLLGGNAVDLPAVQWLLQQPKPWHMVTDMGFIGGKLDSEYVAKALVERAVERGELTVHETLDSAYESFGGKVTLEEAAHPYGTPEEKAHHKVIGALRRARAKAIKARKS